MAGTVKRTNPGDAANIFANTGKSSPSKAFAQNALIFLRDLHSQKRGSVV